VRKHAVLPDGYRRAKARRPSGRLCPAM